MAEYDCLFKLLLVGAAPSGKSSLLLRYCDAIYSPSYLSTIGVDFKIKTISSFGKNIKMQIWDTAGQERFRTITSAYYKGAHGLLLCFNIADRETFNSIDNFFKEVQSYCNANVKVVLLGNCCDLCTERQVSTEEAMAKAQQHGVPYMETSAKDGINVNEAFNLLVKSILDNTGYVKPLPAPAPVNPPAPIVSVAPSEENKEDLKMQAEQLQTKLDAISKIVKALGAEGSLLVENIKKIIAAKSGEQIEVDAEGNVKIQ